MNNAKTSYIFYDNPGGIMGAPVPDSHSISHQWRMRLLFPFLALLAFEIARLVSRINIAQLAGSSGVYTNLAVILLIIISIILTLTGKKLSPFLLTFVLIINFFTTTLYPNESIGSLTSNFSEIVGMSDQLFYVYILLQIGIGILLVVYYFTDHLYGDERKIRVKPRDIEFSKFLSESALKGKDEDDEIWDR